MGKVHFMQQVGQRNLYLWPSQPDKSWEPITFVMTTLVKMIVVENMSKQRKHYFSVDLVGKLVSWCFEPSQPRRIISGLNTNFTLSSRYSFHKSFYHKSCFLSLFIFSRHSAQELASNRVPILFCRPTQEPVLATANTGKNWERF